LDSGEKDSPITKDSPLSEESSPSLSIDDRDSFLTADGGESNVDEDENNKKRCCAGSHCSKATDPTEIRILCHGCLKNSSTFCSRTVCDKAGVRSFCAKCIKDGKHKI